MKKDTTFDLKNKSNALNIDEELAKLELKMFLDILIVSKPELYKKIKTIGDICATIGDSLGIKEVQYYLAGYYSNLGLLSVDQYYNKNRKLTEDEHEILNLHTVNSFEFLTKKGFHISAKLALYHHESPDRSGIHQTQFLKMKESYIIHIVDTFVESVMIKSYRPSYSRKMAIDKSIKVFKENGKIFNEDEMNIIINILEKSILSEIGTIL